MKPRIALCALLLTLSGIGLAAGWRSDDRIHFVEFRDATGPHVFPLGQPIARGDSLGLQSAIMEVAQQQQAKGNDAFLRAMTEGVHYTDSGCIQFITTPSGGRVYFCGPCPGGLGCAQVKAAVQ